MRRKLMGETVGKSYTCLNIENVVSACIFVMKTANKITKYVKTHVTQEAIKSL